MLLLMPLDLAKTFSKLFVKLTVLLLLAIRFLIKATSTITLAKTSCNFTNKSADRTWSSFLLSIFCITLSACSTVTTNSQKQIRKNSFQKVYFASYDNVWRAAQLSLKYPLAQNNMDHGILETEWIKGFDGFKPPHQKLKDLSGVKYKITLTLVKGGIEEKGAVRVNINKQIEKNKNFFAESEQVQTDGLEEKVIFYRIERELLIEDALKKAFEKEAKATK